MCVKVNNFVNENLPASVFYRTFEQRNVVLEKALELLEKNASRQYLQGLNWQRWKQEKFKIVTSVKFMHHCVRFYLQGIESLLFFSSLNPNIDTQIVRLTWL